MNEVSEAVTVDGHRRRIAAHMAGDGALKRIAYIAFGDGGHHPENNTPKPAGVEAESLYHEVQRKPVEAVVQDDIYSATGKGILVASGFPSNVVSEAGLFDEDGNLICWETFPPKFIGRGESYGVNLKLRY